MVKSRIDLLHVTYSENVSKFEEGDENYESNLYTINIYGIKLTIALGKIIDNSNTRKTKDNNSIGDGLIYAYVYAIKDDKVCGKIGVYETSVEQGEEVEMNIEDMDIILFDVFESNPGLLTSYTKGEEEEEEREKEKEKEEEHRELKKLNDFILDEMKTKVTKEQCIRFKDDKNFQNDKKAIVVQLQSIIKKSKPLRKEIIKILRELETLKKNMKLIIEEKNTEIMDINITNPLGVMLYSFLLGYGVLMSEPVIKKTLSEENKNVTKEISEIERLKEKISEYINNTVKTKLVITEEESHDNKYIIQEMINDDEKEPEEKEPQGSESEDEESEDEESEDSESPHGSALLSSAVKSKKKQFTLKPRFNN